MSQPEAPQTIRIDPEVWAALQKLAVPFVDKPNDVLRKLLALDKTSSGAGRSNGRAILDAAARVLEETGTPMKAKEMADAMIAKGYWTTNGQTPEATVGAAIYVDIKNKGDGSRFRKVRRGLFTLAQK
jgi:hypothetical protein